MCPHIVTRACTFLCPNLRGERRVEEYKLVYISDLMNYIATCRKDNMT